MITESLINYIKSQFNKNISRELIISQLSKVGWHMDDIQEGLAKVESLLQESTTQETSLNNETKNIYEKDPYHEAIDPSLDFPASNVTNIAPSDSVKPKDNYQEIDNKDIYKEPIKEELSKEGIEIESKLDNTNEKNSKIWTPTAINPVGEDTPTKEFSPDKTKENTSIEEFPQELNKPNPGAAGFPKDLPSKKLEPFKYQVQEELIPDVKPKDSYTQQPNTEPAINPNINQNIYPESESVVKTREDLIPQKQNQNSEVSKDQTVSQPGPIAGNDQIQKREEANNMTPKMDDFIIPNIKSQESAVLQERQQGAPSNVPKKAMISSYSQDYMSANKLQQEVTQRKRHGVFKFLIIILIFIVVGGLIFASSKGYIKIMGKNISFGNKDPKSLLLNNISKFNSLTSYKVETEATIQLPLFSNITSGLMSGEVVDNNEKEFFSYKVSGKVNKNNKMELFSDYNITLGSSMLSEEIETNIKSSMDNVFVTIPDLSMVFKKEAPPQGVVLMSALQLDQINVIVPEEIRQRINNLDLTKFIPRSNTNYVVNKISAKDLVKNFEITKKDEEKIHDIDTDHYSINIEEQAFKNLLNNILDESFSDLSLDQKTKIKDILGSVSVNSLEFWVGKKDQNIYRYRFSISIPLSKVVGFEDESIANSEVTLDWQTTFYDLDITNQEYTPMEFMNMSDFLKNIADTKIKNTITSFAPLAQEMKNTVGSYGTKSNVTGSCTDPTSGSIFSSAGHSNKASSVVGKIADSMNSIVNKLSGDPQCFSTTKAWSLASPLVSDSSKYFCVDSVGNSRILNESLSTTICE